MTVAWPSLCMKKYLAFAACALLLASCGEYNKVLKSRDIDYKYNYAKKAFEEKKYAQVSTILTDLVTPMRGSQNGEECLYLLARSFYEQDDYMNSGLYFKTYYQRYPKGKFAEDARFYSGYGYYLDSPDPQLDQSVTVKAIEELKSFLDFYPKSARASQVQSAIFEMQDKLTLKELQNAQLYYNLGNFMGNNYQSCIVTCDNALKEYPYSKYREDFELLLLKSKYQIARQSVPERQEDRYREVLDEYYSFVNNFPDSKNLKEAETIFKVAQSHVREN